MNASNSNISGKIVIIIILFLVSIFRFWTVGHLLTSLRALGYYDELIMKTIISSSLHCAYCVFYSTPITLRELSLTFDPETAMSSSVLMATQVTSWSCPQRTCTGRGDRPLEKPP